VQPFGGTVAVGEVDLLTPLRLPAGIPYRAHQVTETKDWRMDAMSNQHAIGSIGAILLAASFLLYHATKTPRKMNAAILGGVVGGVPVPSGMVAVVMLVVALAGCSRTMDTMGPEPEPPPTLPIFSCEPPRPSAKASLEREWLVPAGETASLGDVNEVLKEALDATGYVERSYLALDCDADGFALVTRMERMGRDGRPLDGDARWDLGGGEVRERGFLGWLRALFTAEPGHYRVIVFVVSSNPARPTERVAQEEEVRAWLDTGLSRLPHELEVRYFGAWHDCEVLIYEFEKQSAEDDAYIVQNSLIPALTHLDRNGVRQQLAGGAP